jgi:hypothetical protein
MSTTRRLAFAALFVAGVSAGPAGATQGMTCRAADGGDARVDILFGAGPKQTVLSVGVEAFGTRIATGEGRSGEPAVVLQAFGDGARLDIDLADTQVLHLLAEIRLVFATEGRNSAYAGVLRVVEKGAAALVCEEA